jgi:hypothetical protein
MPISTRTFDLSTLERFRKGLQSNYGKYNDPTYLGFVLLFNDYDVSRSPLLVRDEKKVGSTLNYLAAINDGPRFQYLKLFQELLLDTNYWMPWYWQSVEGIDKIWDYNELKDPFKGGDDAVVKITTLESIDLRITALMDLYRKACFDYEFRREIVPSNLRKFQVTIFIQEIRNIQVNYGTIGNALNAYNSATQVFGGGSLSLPFETPQQKSARETARVSNEFGANLMFTLKFCEFQPDKSSGNFGSVNMAGGEPASQIIQFKYDSIDESYLNPTITNAPPGYSTAGNNYPYLDNLPDPESGSGMSFLEKAKKLASDPDFAKDVANSAAKNAGAALADSALNAIDTLSASGVNAAQGALNRLLLGNVYGFSPSTALSSLQQGSLLSLGPQFQNTAQNSINNNPNTPSNLGNNFT